MALQLLIKRLPSSIKQKRSFLLPVCVPRSSFAATADQKVDDKHKYANTLNLPTTNFPMRFSADTDQRIIRKSQDAFTKTLEANNKSNKPLWILHDGPPFANGPAHLGHAMNKILKDIVNKFKLLQGYHVPYIPGWDCHGLPIEIKAAASKSAESWGPLEIRKKAREFATNAMELQRSVFRSWAVLGDWQRPYITMDPAYEARQLDVFGKMYAKGLIYRAEKPVYYSPSSRTALAEAELEYVDNHVSQSLYVAFKLRKLSEKLAAQLSTKPERISALIWTTTPWTLPANKAICVHPSFQYVAVEHTDGHVLVVAEERLPALRLVLKAPLTNIVAKLTGEDLLGSEAEHPMHLGVSPLLAGDHVTLESGSGLVHTAPGHGLEDFDICRRNGISVFSPVDGHGRFTAAVGDATLVGKSVLIDGNEAAIALFRSKGVILKQESYTHKYPYDWRTKKPIILRAAKQWFTRLEKLQPVAIKALEQVEVIPASGRQRLANNVTGRSDWCISRQRAWGVPIPVFYNKETDEPLINEHTLQHIQSVVRTHGTDAWWSMSVEELLPAELRSQADQYIKGTDTMDVWFDSGSSWDAVLRERGLPLPADMYLEGSDQHRGWFQSSLLTAAAVTSRAPYRTILSHGFVLDEQGRKMSKSLGNVVEPSTIISGGRDTKREPAMGVDALRLWCSSVDYTQDVVIGPLVLQKVAETSRKMRVTGRFLLGNLSDFDPARHSVSYEQLKMFDRYQLHLLQAARTEITKAYEQHHFNRVYTIFTTLYSHLSSGYLDVSKDRLYAMAPNDPHRRSCQTVLHHILEFVMKTAAPITSVLAEELHEAFYSARGDTSKASDSVFNGGWLPDRPEWFQPELAAECEQVLQIRDKFNVLADQARKDKVLKVVGCAEVTLQVPSNTAEHRLLQALTAPSSAPSELTELLQVAKCVLGKVPASAPYRAEVMMGKATVVMQVTNTDMHKCPRCWRFSKSGNSEGVCNRCSDAIARR